MKKALLVISNHNPSSWSEDQKKGWDKIDYIPFPNVLPDKTREELISDEVTKICGMIGEFYAKCDEDGADGYVNLQGEFSTCYYVFMALAGEQVKFIFPTTDRVVEEVTKEDGSVEKKSVFRFIRWR